MTTEEVVETIETLVKWVGSGHRASTEADWLEPDQWVVNTHITDKYDVCFAMDTGEMLARAVADILNKWMPADKGWRWRVHSEPNLWRKGVLVEDGKARKGDIIQWCIFEVKL